jgi:uncharacterized protein YbjQ (UPF0145 family)
MWDCVDRHEQEMNMEHNMVSTSFEIPGYHVRQNLGLVRGVTVRSRSVIGNFAGGIQTLFGGNISIFTELCENARQEAYELMLQHADQMGANAIVGMRYDANDVMDGVTEVLAYGTAVIVDRA